ncbi:hypothetical protein ES708_32261 [subsurface metagenome]
MIKKKDLTEILYNALDSEEEANTHFYAYTIKSLNMYKRVREMYSRENLADIFEKVLQFEEDVKGLYDDCIDKLVDEDIIKVFSEFIKASMAAGNDIS